LNARPCIYYALSLTTKLSLRGLNIYDLILLLKLRKPTGTHAKHKVIKENK